MSRFKVLAGVHSEGGRTYETGDIVDSRSDLTKHNSPGSIKFQRLPDEPDDSSQQTGISRTAGKSNK